MVLDNVTDDAIAIEVSTPSLGPEIFFKSYLNVGNIISIPDRLKD